MSYPILKEESVDIKNFISYWSSFYFDRNENKYNESINKKILDKDNLLALYEWKNGSRLSANKLRSFENKILTKIEILNLFKIKSEFSLIYFLEEFKEVSVIWKIFLLHIVRPEEYSIFDQHVYRAFYFINNSKIKELSNNESEKGRIYFSEYCNFIKNIRSESGMTIKKIDEALWAFGRFLKSNYKKCLD